MSEAKMGYHQKMELQIMRSWWREDFQIRRGLRNTGAVVAETKCRQDSLTFRKLVILEHIRDTWL